MPVITYFYIFIATLTISTILIPPISHLAVQMGGIDKPDERKIHSIETPRLGGVAIFCAVLFSIIFFTDVDKQVRAFLAGAVIIFLTGLIDDLVGISPRQKLVGEIAATTVALLMSSLSITSLGNPLGIGEIALGAAAVPFTIFAIVGVMNAINLIDGLDGLAGGVTSIACLVFGMLAWKCGNSNLLLLVIALLGAVVGFLRYNTYPARIFMGDSGSLFLGYCLGFFSVMLLNSPGHHFSPVTPLILLAIPVLDTLVVMARRKLCGRAIFSPDKTHLHHRLMDLGMGHRFSVLMVYGLSYMMAFSALVLYRFTDSVQFVFLIMFSLLLYTGLRYAACSKFLGQTPIFRENRSFRLTATYRRLVHQSQGLLVSIKYLIICQLLLVVFVNPVYPLQLIWGGAALVTAIIFLLLFGSTWGDSILQAVIYLSGALSVFILDNYGRGAELYGIDLVWASHLLFLFLSVAVTLKIVIRKRAGQLLNSPMEYLILFVVLTIPLLPTELTRNFSLMGVAAKSMIMFVGYKLILIRNAKQNRKILFATMTGLIALLIRYATSL